MSAFLVVLFLKGTNLRGQDCHDRGAIVVDETISFETDIGPLAEADSGNDKAMLSVHTAGSFLTYTF